MLVNGKWKTPWHPYQQQDETGRFVRKSTQYRNMVGDELHFPVEKDRYHLYAAFICPWATRALIARKLKGLEDVVSVSIVDPIITSQGWKFNDSRPEQADINNKQFLHEIYTLSDENYCGRATVPVLWDKKTSQIVNNESADILRIFNSGFRHLANSVDLYPTELQNKIDEFNGVIYNALNNGVYCAGFAKTQKAYEEAYTAIFDCLEKLDDHFSDRHFAIADQLTECDVRLFVTLVRFDDAYYGLFKTNKYRIQDYRNLSRYLKDLLSIPAFAKSTNIKHIKTGYYSIRALNPTGIVPKGPVLDWHSFVTDSFKLADNI